MGYLIGKAVMSAHLPAGERVSDITIGDFWGLQDAASLPLEISEGTAYCYHSQKKGNR